MDMFSHETIRKEELFSRPRMKTLHYVAVLFPSGECDYFDGSDLSPCRDDALEYDDIKEAELDCAILEARNFNASVETFQRYFQ
ncbi:hypothetical protein A6U86_05620 [Rhizobium sp. AC27/96]|uniref:hypothetical protein n=1 Tax=Rhizobium sp. AC27/96 TaxID=1841653 RepID=UPI0008292C4F|nr:hypothetical protein [Rhizobium sp. AC27/96]OCJ12501.1 hypothetical protein A6U86_05620 [Rhizobium sp. AC27/96]